jgi:hypothetical protein
VSPWARHAFERLDDLEPKPLEVGDVDGGCPVYDRIIHGAVFVDQDVPEALDPFQRLLEGLGQNPGRRELLEQIIFLAGKAETETGDELVADVDHGLDRDLKEALAGALLLDSAVFRERRRNDRPELAQITVQLVELRKDPFTIEHAIRPSDSLRADDGSPRRLARCGRPVRRGDPHLSPG